MTPTPSSPIKGHYFVPATSNYSTFLSGGIFMLALGFILRINGTPAGVWSMWLGAGLIVYVLIGWFGEVISESLRGPFGGVVRHAGTSDHVRWPVRHHQ